MKKLLSLIVMLTLLGVIVPFAATVHADNHSDTDIETTDTDDSDEDDSDEDDSDGMQKPKMIKAHMQMKRDEIKGMHMEMKEGVKMNRDEAAQNREDFRMEHKDEIKDVKASLTNEQKEELEELREEFEAEMKELREELKEAETMEEKAEIHAEMKELAGENYEAVKEILGDNAAGLNLIEKRKEVYHMNEDLRQENRDMRKDYKHAKRETIDKYRTAFVKRLGDRLEQIPADKLEQIAERVDGMIEKYENNANISDAKKEAMLSALMALKEIIEEKMEGDETTDEVLEVIEDLID